jgi:hypothetical protein
MTPRFRVAVALFCLLAAAPVDAHHSLQAKFDVKKLVTLKGLITKVEWANPHVYLFLDVTQGNGTVSKWALESLGTNMLRRGGVTKQTLGVGDNVTIVAYHAKDGLNFAFVRKIKFADGREVEVWLGDPNQAR